MRTTLPTVWLLASASFPALAAQTAPSPCAHPRAVLEGLLYWQRPEHTDLARAGRCFDMPVEARATRGGELARQLLAFFDARGHYVRLDEAPAQPDFADPAGRHRYQPFPRLGDAVIVKVGDEWLWSAGTVEAIPSLHDAAFVVDIDSAVSRLPEWMRQPFLGFSLWQLGGLFLLILVALLVRGAVRQLVRVWERGLMERLGVQWGAEAMSRVAQPIGTAAGAGTVGLLLPLLQLGIRLSQIGTLAVRVVVVFSAVWATYRMVDLFGAWLLERAERTATKLDDQLVPLVTKALKIFVVAVGAVFVLQNLDVDVAGLLAGLGLGGLAFALAAKDTVANLFGSATIFADRPFQVGDWVVIGDAEGTVEQVGFRSTKIRTFYNSLVSIPNAKVGDSVIDNLGERRYRRYKAHLDVTYDTPTEKLQAFVEGIRAIVQANPHMRKDYYHAYFNDFGPASLKILVYVFFEVPTWGDELRERHNFLLEILRLAEALEVEFAFPTQTLHVASQAEPQPPAEQRLYTEAELIAAVQGFAPGGDKSRPGGPRLTGGYHSG